MSPTENTEVTFTQMTPEEYVKAAGVRCPFCGGEDIQGGSFSLDAGEVSQSVDCLACDETWIDVYILDRYID